jgi:hypothetical protein
MTACRLWDGSNNTSSSRKGRIRKTEPMRPRTPEPIGLRMTHDDEFCRRLSLSRLQSVLDQLFDQLTTHLKQLESVA